MINKLNCLKTDRNLWDTSLIYTFFFFAPKLLFLQPLKNLYWKTCSQTSIDFLEMPDLKHLAWTEAIQRKIVHSDQIPNSYLPDL